MKKKEKLGKIRISFLPHGKEGTFSKGKVSIFDAAKTLNINLPSFCGGRGTCGKCKIKIKEGKKGLNKITYQELEHLTEDEILTGYRLACQTFPNTNISVYVPEGIKAQRHRLQVEGLEVSVNKLKPLVRKFFVKIPKTSLNDFKSDEDRLLKILNREYNLPSSLKIDFQLAINLAHKLRDADWAVTAILWKNRIIDIEAGNTSAENFGFAFDLGTTKLAGFLLNLNNGKVIAVSSRINPQIQFGEEVIERINYQIKKGREGIRELQEAVVSGINEIIIECCKKV